MATIEQNPVTSYDHTDKICERRKELFPCQDLVEDSGSDLGHMSPLYTDSNNSDDDNCSEAGNKHTHRPFVKANINDYLILNNVCEDSCASSEASIPFLHLSPAHPLLISPLLYSPDTIKPNTTTDKSPSDKLKTPHDNTTIKVNSKQTKRKLQEASDEYETFGSKSKARTALFAEPVPDVFLPAKSFYPKANLRSEHSVPDISSYKLNVRKIPSVKRRKYNITRLNGGGGVRHKIKKPKLKKIMSKEKIMKAAINIIENSKLNDYLDQYAKATPVATVIASQTKDKAKISPPKQITFVHKSCENKENIPSPELEKIKANNKFFKSSRTSKAVVKILDNVNVTVLGKKVDSPPKPVNTSGFDLFTQDFQEKSFETSMNVSAIIKSLEDDWTEQPEDDLAKKAELILSPTSQMCDLTSGLAINSPKKAKLNINKLLNSPQTNNSFIDMEKRLFPLFYPEHGKRLAQANSIKSPPSKKMKILPDDQMILDAGQKKFGLTECPECKLVYNAGSSNDELEHYTYHNGLHILKFSGWKNERVVSQISLDERIIKISPGDPKAWWKKLKLVADYVNRDLGFFEETLPIDETHFYLYIKDKQIVGCLIAESRQTAYQYLGGTEVDLCSEMSYPIKCGVSRIWVSMKHRKCGIATAMMNSLRKTFVYGYILDNNDLGLSAPTEDGKCFAKKYFKTDNFMIYM